MSSISCSSSGDFTLELTKERIHTNFSDLSTEEKKFDCNASVSASEMSLDISPRWVSSSRPKFTSQPTQILINSPPPPNSMITNFFYKVRSICIRTCRLFYGVVYAAIFIGLLCSMFLAEIVVAVVYRDEIMCSSTVMSIFNWLILDAVVGVMWMIALICFIYLDVDLKGNSCDVIAENDRCKVLRSICQLTLIIISLFRGSWLIIGSVIFWRDCPTLQPKPVRDMMWAVLLVSYIAIFLRLLQTKGSADD